MFADIIKSVYTIGEFNVDWKAKYKAINNFHKRLKACVSADSEHF